MKEIKQKKTCLSFFKTALNNKNFLRKFILMFQIQSRTLNVVRKKLKNQIFVCYSFKIVVEFLNFRNFDMNFLIVKMIFEIVKAFFYFSKTFSCFSTSILQTLNRTLVVISNWKKEDSQVAGVGISASILAGSSNGFDPWKNAFCKCFDARINAILTFALAGFSNCSHPWCNTQSTSVRSNKSVCVSVSSKQSTSSTLVIFQDFENQFEEITTASYSSEFKNVRKIGGLRL